MSEAGANPRRRRRAEHAGVPGDLLPPRGVRRGHHRRRRLRPGRRRVRRLRRRDQRRQDARPQRSRSAPGGEGDLSRDRRHHDHRLRHHRDGDRRHEAGGLRLRHQALQGGRAAPGGGEGPREEAPHPREPQAPDRAAHPAQEPVAGGNQLGDAEGLRSDRPGGRNQDERPDQRRQRHRQGVGGARHPRPERAAGSALRRRQLRRDPRESARIGAVRPREGGLHGCGSEQGRSLRDGRPGDPLPRRGRRAAPTAPGQAAPGDPGQDGPACRRHRRSSRRRAHRGCDEPEAGRRDLLRTLSRRPLLPAQRDPDHAASAPRADGRHPAADAALHREVRRGGGQGGAGHLRCRHGADSRLRLPRKRSGAREHGRTRGGPLPRRRDRARDAPSDHPRSEEGGGREPAPRRAAGISRR